MNNNNYSNYLYNGNEKETFSRERKRVISRFYATPANNILTGRIPPNISSVHIICNSENAPFEIEMPPLGTSQDVMFYFYNLPKNGSGNNVTIVGKILNTTELILEPLQTAVLTDSMAGYFLAMTGA